MSRTSASQREWPDKHSLDQSVEGPTLLHYCEHGHSWTEQPDGGVSPSWAMAGSSIKYPGWDPRCCPEPKRVNRQIKCEGCGERFYAGHGTPGVMSDPWNYNPKCQPAKPVCAKPPVQTFLWVERKGRTFSAGWVEVTARQLSFSDLEPVTPGNAIPTGRRS